MADHDMVQNFEFEQLSRADDVASDPDVRLGRGVLAAYAAYGISGVMPHLVLCRMARESPQLCCGYRSRDAA